MHKRGTTAYETTIFLVLLALLIAGISSTVLKQLSTSKKFFSNAALGKSLQEMYQKAELLPSGSRGQAKIFVPKNVSHATTEPRGDGWVLRLTLDGRDYEKESKIKLVFMPDSLMETAGMHKVLIVKESEKSAAIIEMQ